MTERYETTLKRLDKVSEEKRSLQEQLWDQSMILRQSTRDVQDLGFQIVKLDNEIVRLKAETKELRQQIHETQLRTNGGTA